MEGVLCTKDYQHFTVQEDGRILLTFEGAKKAAHCLPGDRVLVENTVITLKEKGPHPVLAGYLELDSKTTYGMTNRGVPLYLFVPLNTSYPPFIVASKEKDRRYKQVALVDPLEWDETRELPRGALKRLLGPAGTLEAEEEGLLWNVCPWKNLTTGLDISEDDAPSRLCLTGLTFNVDPAGCKDIDDCITFEPEGDKYRVAITISDVAACVAELSAMDCMAAVQGQTLYRDGVAIRPMLPPALSEGACSLLPGVERLGVSLCMTWVPGTSVSNLEWRETSIQNQRSYRYEHIEPEHALLLGKLAKNIAKKDIEESLATASSDAEHPMRDPHEWIEILMKFYNCEAAKLLVKAKAGILRRHSAPDIERLEKYTSMDPSLVALANSAAEYCLVDDADTHHFGIGEAAYCHATSPLRRYADLVNQRILKQVIRNNLEGLMVTVPIDDLNQRFKVSKGYERDRQFLQCLLGSGTREFDARILDVLEDKVVLWVPLWKQRIKIAIGEKVFAEGAVVRIRCAIHLGMRRWKDRMVVEILS